MKAQATQPQETPESLLRDFRQQAAEHCRRLRDIAWGEVDLPDQDLDEEICIIEQLLADLQMIRRHDP
jgi:hypothetical protein